MSRGALKELIGASISKFTSMTKDIPLSERKEIRNVLLDRVLILEGI